MAESNPPENTEQIVFTNVMEELVKSRVRDTLKELGACECSTCYHDACALALNMLKPQYVTTRKGALLTEITEMENANSVNILFAVTKAVMTVKEHPRH